MSLYEKTVYIEIPITVLVEYTPAEAPDYSETSPCAGSPALFETVNIILPGLPTTPDGTYKWLCEQSPDWEENVQAEIEGEIEEHKAEAAIERHIWRDEICGIKDLRSRHHGH